MVWLHPPRRLRRPVLAGPVRCVVIETQNLARLDRGADRDEMFGVHLRALRVVPGDGGDLQGVHPLPQPGWHHLPDRRQGSQRSLFDSGDGRRRRLQCDGDRDRLLVVEKQWRQVGTGIEPVAAVRSFSRSHRIAQLAQPVDIATDGPRTYFEPVGQGVTRPITAGLQQRQQPQ